MLRSATEAKGRPRGSGRTAKAPRSFARELADPGRHAVPVTGILRRFAEGPAERLGDHRLGLFRVHNYRVRNSIRGCTVPEPELAERRAIAGGYEPDERSIGDWRRGGVLHVRHAVKIQQNRPGNGSQTVAQTLTVCGCHATNGGAENHPSDARWVSRKSRRHVALRYLPSRVTIFMVSRLPAPLGLQPMRGLRRIWELSP